MIDTGPIQRFLLKVRQANTANARDIRLTLSEATELTAALAQVLAAQASRPVASSPQPAARMVLDGGTL